MNPFANPRVTRRFIILMGVATFVMFSFWAVLRGYLETPPGDYEMRQGDILLGDGDFAGALDRFDAALAATPNHRGALMGRALVFLQSGRDEEAEAEFTYLIDFLAKTVTPEDPTGIGVLAAAYNNRGILFDRQCRHQEALDDYVSALQTDEEVLEGPGILQNILYGTPDPSTARLRARFLYENLPGLKPGECLTEPEKDAKERMYKP